MKSSREEPRKGKAISPEEIIEYCRQKFVNILPNTFNRQQGGKPAPQQDNLAPINIMYRREEIKQVIRQLSIFLQLVIQNCVLTSDPKIRTECLKLLGNFRNYLCRDLEEFENMVSSRIKGKLPEYEVDCKPFLKKDVTLRIPPQISLYQDPLLFYIYDRAAQQQLFCNHSIMMTREERIEVLKSHLPFFNPLFVPIVEERLQTKAKFTELEDRLLMMIIASPRRDIGKLRMIYFPNRPEQQIKNRIKNLCGNGKDLNNPIKEMKANEYLPLTQPEIDVLLQAYNRYGPRWPVISRYYQIRTPQFLEAEFLQCDKLVKKRAKEDIEIGYGSLKEVLEEKLSKLKVRVEQMEMEEIQEENGDEERRSPEESMEEERNEPHYRIINNMTFLVEDI